jgi:hypothetical protein
MHACINDRLLLHIIHSFVFHRQERTGDKPGKWYTRKASGIVHSSARIRAVILILNTKSDACEVVLVHE